MNEKRQFPRYKVSGLSEIRGQIDRRHEGSHVVTFGEGGCGFYEMNQASPLEPIRRVFCTFEMKNILPGAVEVQGTLVYAKPLDLNGRRVIFYGVEFLESHRAAIIPIVKKLEALKGEGKIESA